MFTTQFLTVAIVHLLAVMSPGPDFAVVTRNSLFYSRNTGIFTSLGIALGISIHVTYCLLGIGLLISQSIVLFNIIKLVGAGYLIYFGYKSLRAKPHTAVPEETTAIKTSSPISHRAAVWAGFLTNVLNPKATLFFLALFTQVINPSTPKFVQSLYGLEMMVITFVWFGLVAFAFSHRHVKVRITKIQHHIERVTGVVLIGLGIKVALASHK